MRHIVLITSFIALTTIIVHAQVSISHSASLPDASAMLDIQSTQKGMLMPRMTDAQRVAIASPATALIVYQTDGTRGYYYYDGAVWSLLSVSNADWKVDGNSGTTPALNFIGTTDNQPLCFRVNNESAGRISTDGNTFIGYESGLQNTTGYSNVAMGGAALKQTTTGYQNVAIGYNALLSNMNTSNNVAVGTEALKANTTYGNTAVGAFALTANTEGLSNSAFGILALTSNTTGGENTAVGRWCMRLNQTGENNASLGSLSMYDNISGSENTAIGVSSLSNNSSGGGNVALGRSSMSGNTLGNYNTAIGYESGSGNATGAQNVSIGYTAGQTNVYGNANTIIGGSADVMASNLSNATAIGWTAKVSASNSFVLGGTGTNQVKVGIGLTAPLSDFHVKQDNSSGEDRGIRLEQSGASTGYWRLFTGGGPDPDFGFALGDGVTDTQMSYINGNTGAYTVGSDARFKKDILPLEEMLPLVRQLEPKSYTYIYDQSGSKSMGFIAQEIQEIFPELVDQREDGYLSIAYDNFAVIAIKAIKEQQVIIDQLLQRVQALEQE